MWLEQSISQELGWGLGSTRRARWGPVEPTTRAVCPQLCVSDCAFQEVSTVSPYRLKRSLHHLCPASSVPCTAPWRPHPGTTQLHWSHLGRPRPAGGHLVDTTSSTLSDNFCCRVALLLLPLSLLLLPLLSFSLSPLLLPGQPYTTGREF